MTRVLGFVAEWDPKAGVWWAECTGPEGIVTEAPTVEALRERLKLIVPDYLDASGADAEEIRIDVSFTSSDVIKAA